MISTNFNFSAKDGKQIYGYRWSPDKGMPVRGIVQISHGMAETAARYGRFAGELCAAGYEVYAHDHRGHGKTAGSPDEIGYIADTDSFGLLVDDLHGLNTAIRQDHPDRPVFLFAHSMGSFVGQRYIQLHGEDLGGVILSGTNGKQGMLLDVAKIAARSEVRKNGRKERSPKLDKLSFGNYNKPFSPNRTKFDWLSRDEAEVDAYIQNPYCGAVFSAGFFFDLVSFLKEIEKTENVRMVPPTLPTLLVSGAKDPVGKAGKGVMRLYQTYRKLGVKDLECKLYPDARHEILNETNRDEVTRDVLGWIGKHS